VGVIAEKTIILLPSLPGVDELCAALMIACADKANTTVYTGQKSYPTLYHEFLQPDGVKFLAQQDINKQIELSLKLSPEDSAVKNIRWDSDQSELKIFVELEERKGSAGQVDSKNDKGIESLEASTITAKQVGFDHILSFASSAEEIEDYPILRDSGRLFGGKLVKLVAENPVTASYSYLMAKSTDGKAALNTESSKYYEIGQKYYNSYKSSGSSLFTTSQGQLFKTTDKQVQILLDFWSGKLELEEEGQVWELFALIMLTPSFNPLIQEGIGSFAGVAKSDSLKLRAGKIVDSQSEGKVVLQRVYHEYSITVSTAPEKVAPVMREARAEVAVTKQPLQVTQTVSQNPGRIRGKKRQPNNHSTPKDVITSTKSIAVKKTEYIPLAPAKSND